ncbi:MAG: hypothetical protein R3F62_05760 [Planctomycetota bacterium]
MDVEHTRLRRALDADPHDPELQARYARQLEHLGPGALEAHLRQYPDDDPAWLAWATLLEAEGDARAALVRLQPGAPRAHRLLDSRERALLAEHPALSGPFGGLQASRHRLGWAHGYWHHVSNWAASQPPSWWEDLYAHPSARFLRSLHVRWLAPEEFVRVTVAARPPLRVLRWQEEHPEPVALDAIQAALPDLEQLDLWVPAICDTWRWPALRALSLNICWTPQLKLDLVRAAERGAFAELESLELWPGFDQATEPVLAAFLARCPRLTHLDVRGGNGLPELEQVLLDSPALDRLRFLSMSGAHVSEASARRYLERLRARATPIPHLRLNLDGLRDPALRRSLESTPLRFQSSR